NMNGTGVLVLEGNNNYTGTTTISSGTLQVGQASDLAAPVNALPAAVTDNAGAILGFGSSQSMTISSLISGAGGVRQSGTGTTTLTGNNTYTGPTSVVAGTLRTATLPNGGVNSPIGKADNTSGNLILSGGTLQYAGSGGSTDRLFTIVPTGG